MRIFLVEDEEQIRKMMKFNLEAEGYEVVTASDGKEALGIIDGQHFDLIILDIMLPGLNGYQICENIRLRNEKVGILMVSAKDSSQDRIMGLKLGADDYLVKPFNLEEFLLRVNNLIKRSTEEAKVQLNEFQFGNNNINFVTFEATHGNKKIDLTNKEALLLKMLIERKNEVVSRQHILQNVWGYDIYPSTRTIDNFILSFRKYFEDDPRNPKYFHSIRGVGYKFTSEN
ncbi:MAG TPA: response regulator transcription factor [Saprospiraceae bacterium]|nr:response regulator transcription factor [Saprospiraceae bacterium]MCB9327644.1 response regulator transcription factor [Lewinellaceae bacterium]HPK10996.1 response regulator transcription factor [Saprospiraceae bacterium]HPQ22409.1 response regulator transcription factor [Saprospiraceae bacterium]HRX28935.1 response regulator transcription factor [Saprospiraceae bacterium]